MSCLRNGFSRRGRRSKRAFTLIEVLVVVAIIALLVAILLPSLQAAREHAKTVVCSSNMHSVSLANANYLYVSKAVYAPSYVYPDDKDGRWSPATQPKEPRSDVGYLHWSYYLFDDGNVGDKAFECPTYENGGAPRTNPGPEPASWEAGQEDINGNPKPAERKPSYTEDKQASRMAITANAAIMPRNKFNIVASGGKRVNVFVRENQINRPGDTILATEFYNNWQSQAISGGSGNLLVKSHRPLNPFYHVGAGFDEYKAPDRAPGFMYGQQSTLGPTTNDWGILPYKEIRQAKNLIETGTSELNAVGRDHPWADRVYRKKFGGSANFLYCDGHAENDTIYNTVEDRKWGDKYYSLSGANEVLNFIIQRD
ncbi:MAG: type II secretion system protein [Phycisphaerae bacterium]|nr:type II secretion system protein [Phycisphaerae bacterium]